MSKQDEQYERLLQMLSWAHCRESREPSREDFTDVVSAKAVSAAPPPVEKLEALIRWAHLRETASAVESTPEAQERFGAEIIREIRQLGDGGAASASGWITTHKLPFAWPHPLRSCLQLGFSR